GWYAVLQVPTYEPEEEFALRLLVENGVSVHPGFFFDFPHETFVVVSLLPPPDRFAAGIFRILRHFDCSARTGPNESASRRSDRSAVFLSIDSKLGNRRAARCRADGVVADERRITCVAVAAAQRDGTGAAVAVFGHQRDGNRSDFYPSAWYS